LKIFRSIVLLLLLLVFLAGGALWFATRPSTAAPPAAPASADTPGDASVSGADDPEALLRRLRRDGTLPLGAYDLAALTRSVMSGSVDGREFLRISRDLGATINDEFVEIGGSFDLAALDESALSADARAAVRQMRSTVPFLLNGERYLGVRGMPRAVDGNLGFGSDATLRIGTLGLPVGLLTFLGSQEEILRTSWSLPDLYVTRVAVVDDQLQLDARELSR